jgi:hypothetical protein
MFQSKIFGCKEQNRAASMDDQLSFVVEMSAGSEGKMVTSSTVMNALLWQQYGIDPLHPEMSRWLEQNAADVKYAAAHNNNNKTDTTPGLRVGNDGTINVRLSQEVDRRLREVSSQYIIWQLEQGKEEEERIATPVYLNKSAVGQSMDSYRLAYQF